MGEGLETDIFMQFFDGITNEQIKKLGAIPMGIAKLLTEFA